MLSGVGWWHTYAIEDAGLPAIFMCDGPHGLRIQTAQSDHLGLNESRKAICYPTESTVACSFDRDLLYELGKTLGTEARQAKVDMLLGPGVNIKRNALCGRNFEYYSEDPIVSGELGAAFIKGLQSTGVSACVKHFACNNIEYRRNISDSRLDERTLREVYLKPFEIIVRSAKPRAIMSAYNLVNGVHCSENKTLLTDILKNEWKYDGIVVSDWGAVSDATKSITAGLDLEMPFSGSYEHLLAAYENGEVSEEEIDRAFSRIERFVKESVQNREKNTQGAFDESKAESIACRAAAESQVLLKNDHQFFPIKKEEKILLIGELAIKPRYQGGGSSHINNDGAISLYVALSEIGLKVDFVKGFDMQTNTVDPEFSISKIAQYDKVIVAIGQPESEESEGFDRSSMRLNAAFEQFVANVLSHSACSGVLIYSGAPIELPFIDLTDAAFFCGLPGEFGSLAIADVLTGKENPCGKLAETWVKKQTDLVTYSKAPGNGKTVEYREGVFVGYRYYEAKSIEPLFSFGHGLSYTSFSYGAATVREANGAFILSCPVTNTGKLCGKETVFLFVKHPLCDELRPVKILMDFAKAEFECGETKTITFTIKKEELSVYNLDGEKYIPGGEYCFIFASSSDREESKVLVYIEKPKPRIDEFTLMSEICEYEDWAARFREVILMPVMKHFGLTELPESTRRILWETPLKGFRGLAPVSVTHETIKKFIDELNGSR